MNYNYISIDRIFTKLIRDVTDEFSEGDVIEWCGDALEFIGAAKYYEEAVAFIEVKNHQCNLPNGLHSIIQIARNNSWTGPADDKFCPAAVVKDKCLTNPADPDCECAVDKSPDFIVLGCDGMPINDYEVAYYRPYFDLQYEYFNWRNSSMCKTSYTPIRLATHTLFNSLVCMTDEVNTPYYNSLPDKYTIIRNKIARFSFLEGSVAIAYTRQVTDSETGYPLIPDNISYTTAIVKYITMMMWNKRCYAGRDGACGLADKASKDWQWYCGQASNVDKMPYGIDEYQNLLDQRSYMLPNRNDYYSFFGNMAEPEQRGWNDPNNRNHKARYFIGN